MIFKNQAGEIVTPQQGDYVMASDIDGEEMHNDIRDAFGACGASVEYGVFGNFCGDDLETACVRWGSFGIYWSSCCDFIGDRRIYPYEQTLFEAAKDAPDGTRFMLKTMTGDVLVKRKTATNAWVLEWEDGASLSHSSLGMVDFDIVSLGPKKRDCDVTVLRLAGTLSAEVPDDMVDDCVGAFDLIARLCMWEGAQIGKPGYVLSHIKNVEHSPIEPIYTKMVLPYSVTFKDSPEQCLASWKAECPEMFE